MHILEIKLRFKGDFTPAELESILAYAFRDYNIETVEVIRWPNKGETEVTITKKEK